MFKITVECQEMEHYTNIHRAYGLAESHPRVAAQDRAASGALCRLMRFFISIEDGEGTVDEAG